MSSSPASAELAPEMMRQLERLAASDPDDDADHRATIVATSTDGDQFTVIYRQHWSPQLLGRRGAASVFSGLFEPPLTPSRLAGIVLQGLSEPGDPGLPGPSAWAEGLVPHPESVLWLHDLA